MCGRALLVPVRIHRLFLRGAVENCKVAGLGTFWRHFAGTAPGILGDHLALADG